MTTIRIAVYNNNQNFLTNLIKVAFAKRTRERAMAVVFLSSDGMAETSRKQKVRTVTRRVTYVTRCQVRLRADRVLLITTIFQVDEHITTELG